MIYKFETECCPMCKQAERLLKKHNIKCETVDVYQDTAMAEFYGVRSVPCLVAAESLGENAITLCRAPQCEDILVQFLKECERLNVKNVYEEL